MDTKQLFFPRGMRELLLLSYQQLGLGRLTHKYKESVSNRFRRAVQIKYNGNLEEEKVLLDPGERRGERREYKEGIIKAVAFETLSGLSKMGKNQIGDKGIQSARGTAQGQRWKYVTCIWQRAKQEM